MTYYLKALRGLWTARNDLGNETFGQVLGKIFLRQYRLSWLRRD